MHRHIPCFVWPVHSSHRNPRTRLDEEEEEGEWEGQVGHRDALARLGLCYLRLGRCQGWRRVHKRRRVRRCRNNRPFPNSRLGFKPSRQPVHPSLSCPCCRCYQPCLPYLPSLPCLFCLLLLRYQNFLPRRLPLPRYRQIRWLGRPCCHCRLQWRRPPRSMPDRDNAGSSRLPWTRRPMSTRARTRLLYLVGWIRHSHPHSHNRIPKWSLSPTCPPPNAPLKTSRSNDCCRHCTCYPRAPRLRPSVWHTPTTQATYQCVCFFVDLSVLVCLVLSCVLVS